MGVGTRAGGTVYEIKPFPYDGTIDAEAAAKQIGSVSAVAD